jgi:hypothetical protein
MFHLIELFRRVQLVNTTKKEESGGCSKKALASVQTVAKGLMQRLIKRRNMRRR